MALQVRRGTNAERLTITPAEGELIYVTDTKQLYVGDGTTQGGTASIANTIDSLLSDTTPQLGGNLDLNNYNITGTGNINIAGTINATGNINLGDGVGGDIINLGGDIAGNLIPDGSDSRNIGSQTRFWKEAWISQLNVNSQITAERIQADIIADDSTVVFNSATGAIAAAQLTGTLPSGVFPASITTNIVGNVTGNVNGNTTGYHTGDVTGSVFADDSSLMIDATNQKITTQAIFTPGGDLQIEGSSLNISSAGAVNIGANNEAGTFQNGQLAIKRSGGAGVAMSVNTYQDGDNISDIKAVKHRGTISSPLPYQNNDRTMELVGQAFDGTANRENCFLQFRATAAVSNNVAPGKATMNVANAAGTFTEFAFDNDGTYTAINLKSNAGFVQFGSMSTVDRDALTAANGMVIYNTTDNKFQGYENGAWANLI